MSAPAESFHLKEPSAREKTHGQIAPLRNEAFEEEVNI